MTLSADDFRGDLAERYGYVNRALLDAELDGFVDALARRIAGFEKEALVAAKRFVNETSLPDDALFPLPSTSSSAQSRGPQRRRGCRGCWPRGSRRGPRWSSIWASTSRFLLQQHPAFSEDETARDRATSEGSLHVRYRPGADIGNA